MGKAEVELKDANTQILKNSRIQEFKNSRIQEFKKNQQSRAEVRIAGGKSFKICSASAK
jgi:hypothetical protein